MQVYSYKVTPIDRVINECKRRADDAWWDGNDDEARLHEQEAKLMRKIEMKGDINGFRTSSSRCAITFMCIAWFIGFIYLWFIHASK